MWIIWRKTTKKTSKTFEIVALIFVILVVSVGIYVALTSPRTIVSFPVSFTIGADVESKEFDVPMLHSLVQVEVAISTGSALWTASILNHGDTLWTHVTAQGGQTTYKSEWIQIRSGHYNFTFGTAGLGTLAAEIKVTSKGGFW
jgi:uncharacterized membrane protein